MQGTTLAVSFETTTTTGSVALTGAEKFPCKVMCVSVFFSQKSPKAAGRQSVKSHAHQKFGAHLISLKIVLKRYNSPVDWIRELFKLSTDSASLLVSIKKTLFDLGVRFSLGDVTKKACFWIFDPLQLSLGANPISHFYGSKFFWKLDDHPRLQSLWLTL